MNRSKSRIDILVLEDGPAFGYVARGHHDSAAFAQAVREQEGLPSWQLSDHDPFIERGHMDASYRKRDENYPGAFPVTYWYEAAK